MKMAEGQETIFDGTCYLLCIWNIITKKQNISLNVCTGSITSLITNESDLSGFECKSQ